MRPKPRSEALVPQAVEASAETPPPVLTHVKPAQTGRVLPSLIVQEPAPAASEALPEPKTRRPYTRRAKPLPAEAVVPPVPVFAPETKPAAPLAAAPVASASPDRKRASDRNTVQQLALGQRWKRRLSRWSR